jgi:lycopene beta-cyclase
MNIPSNLEYLIQLLLWIIPIILVEWLFGFRTFLRNATAIWIPTLLGGLFFSFTNAVAVRERIWFYDRHQTLGIFVGPLPVEDVLFYFLSCLLVAQTFLLFLPKRMLQ